MNIPTVNTSHAMAVCPKCKAIQNPDIQYDHSDAIDGPEPLPWSHKCFYCGKKFSQGSPSSKFKVVLPPGSKVVQADIEKELGADLLGTTTDKTGNVIAELISLPTLDDEEFKAFVNRIGTGANLTEKAQDIARRLYISERAVWNYIRNGVPTRNRSVRQRVEELSRKTS